MAAETDVQEHGKTRTTKGIPKDRSPNYPVLDLQKALEKAEAIHREFRIHETPIGIVHERWDFKAHSGLGNQIVAALKAYGLIEVTGQGEQRKVSISSEADRILRNAPDKDVLLRAAALRPAIHKELWDHFQDKGGIPPNELLRHYLVWDRPDPKFNEKSVDPFIERFRRTLAFAKLDAGDIIKEDQTGDDQGNGDRPTPKAGDYVQWTSQGVDQFPEPRKVLGITQDGFAFVEGSPTGLPMNQLAVQTPPVPEDATPTPPKNPFFQQQQGSGVAVGSAIAKVTLVPSEPTIISFPLPGGNVIEIRLRSKVSLKDFERIKTLVELSEDSLVDNTQVSMILDRGLTVDEKAKLVRLDPRLSALFAAAGYIVRVCEGSGQGEDRKIGFLLGLVGPAVFSLSSSDFLASADDALLTQISGLLSAGRH